MSILFYCFLGIVTLYLQNIFNANIMKKLLVSLLFLASVSLLSAQETYYWYENTKEPMKVLGETYYIGYEENTDIDNFLSSESNKDKVLTSEVIKFWGINYINEPSKPIHWAVVTQELKDEILESFEIPYITPDYELNGGVVNVSSLLYVKLKQEADYTLLEQYAAVHNTTIVGEDDSMKNLYVLLCRDISEGSSVEVANYLYETGLFEYAEPDLFGELKKDPVLIRECSNQQILLSPNSVKDYLTLTVSTANNELKIFDLQGKKIMQQNVGFSAEVNVSMLPKGTYVLVMNNLEKMTFIKH